MKPRIYKRYGLWWCGTSGPKGALYGADSPVAAYRAFFFNLIHVYDR